MTDLPTPYYLIDKAVLRGNMEKIARLRERSGVRALLALKCFATWSVFDVMRDFMDGTTSSSLFELRLGAEEFGKDALAADTFEIIVARVPEALKPFEDRHLIASEIDAGRVHMLGTSGTVTTLGAIYLDLPRYDRSRVDGLSIRMESIKAICANLTGLDYDSRHHHPCIGPGRADLIVMGCAIITAIRRQWPATNLTAADRGIREGLLLDMIATAASEPIEAP